MAAFKNTNVHLFMMRFPLLLLFVFGTEVGKAQSLTDLITVIRKIKIETISNEERDSLLLYRSYNRVVTDSERVEHLNLIFDTLHLSASINYSVNGSSEFTYNDFRVFKKNQNELKVLYSQNSGMNSFANQDLVKLYDYNKKTGLLKEDTVSGKVFNIALTDFFKPHVSDTIIKKFSTHSGFSLSLCYGPVRYILTDFISSNRTSENFYLKGDVIQFLFKQGKFIRTGAHFIN